MEDKKTDIVMQFVSKNGGALLAECGLEIWKDDPLMTDFKCGVTGPFGNFFEINDFDFSMSLKDEDKSRSSLSPDRRTDVVGAFANWAGWRSASKSDKIPFPLEFDSFSFKRHIDRASPRFMQACFASTTFPSAALVKRLSQGGDLPPAAYLRFDFTQVLITSVEWDDGEAVEERCRFICKGMTITYSQQQASGTMFATTSTTWPNPNNQTIVNIRK